MLDRTVFFVVVAAVLIGLTFIVYDIIRIAGIDSQCEDLIAHCTAEPVRVTIDGTYYVFDCQGEKIEIEKSDLGHECR